MFIKKALFNKQLFLLVNLQRSLNCTIIKKNLLQFKSQKAEMDPEKIEIPDLNDKYNFNMIKQNQDKSVSYNSYLFKQKRNNYFNWIKPIKFTYENNLKKFGLGLFTLSQRPFTFKEEKNNNSKPHVAYGGDFMRLVTKSTIFVDKTMFIEEIINDPSEGILITMPRRWGKSVNLDMLRRFLAIQVIDGEVIKNNTTDNYKLFAGGEIMLEESNTKKLISPCKLAINNPKLLQFQGQSPVIYMDFKECIGENLQEVKLRLKQIIIRTIENFDYLINSKSRINLKSIGELYSKLLENTKQSDYSFAIFDLSALLYHHHNRKVWILIDEYDAAANEAYLRFPEAEAENVALLFKSVLRPALKGNPYLEKGVMTGILPILISDMYSGLNHFSIVNLMDKLYSKYYGIDQDEMNLLLEHFKVSNKKASEIKIWYNGYKSKYKTNDESIFVDKYNIWSVISCLNKDEIESYWENGSLDKFLNSQILKNEIIKNNIESLLNDNQLTIKEMKENFDINEFKVLKEIYDKHDVINMSPEGVKTFFTFLFFNGYLTITPKEDEYTIPNNEIRMNLKGKVLTYYKEIFRISPDSVASLARDLHSIFIKDDIIEISNIFTEKIGPKFESLISGLELYNNNSKPDAAKGIHGNESLFHLLLGYIAFMVNDTKFGNEIYVKKSDQENKGRIDITLSKNGIGLIIEMKYTKDNQNTESNIQIINNNALLQAKNYQENIKDNNTKIFVVCNVTDTKKVYLSGEIISKDQSKIFKYSKQVKDDSFNLR